MKIEKASCPYCGAALKIRPGQQNTECEYCGCTVLITDTDEDFRRRRPEQHRNIEQNKPFVQQKNMSQGFQPGPQENRPAAKHAAEFSARSAAKHAAGFSARSAGRRRQECPPCKSLRYFRKRKACRIFRRRPASRKAGKAFSFSAPGIPSEKYSSYPCGFDRLSSHFSHGKRNGQPGPQHCHTALFLIRT